MSAQQVLAWILKHLYKITSIRFVPRNANNMIVPGNSYMLLYYDGEWKEHKVLRAEHQYLDFENVPVATLYWLRNLTERQRGTFLSSILMENNIFAYRYCIIVVNIK